jgi:hypothetical protein
MGSHTDEGKAQNQHVQEMRVQQVRDTLELFSKQCPPPTKEVQGFYVGSLYIFI